MFRPELYILLSLPNIPLTPERQYQRGYVLVTYRGVPLGFANNVGTRLNNAYPQAWRIRSTYAPDSPPVLDL